jgi:hypothetical protein
MSMKIVNASVWELSFTPPWQLLYYKYKFASLHSLNKDFKRVLKFEINLQDRTVLMNDLIKYLCLYI